ncbi:phosphonate metabolism transcriptional regulator PhnF [Citreimonas salinaria]|uniref:Transcriptional regulator, GntR family n=1 Tax=Citreimonas salinaria TaxID=321339 RepID=A0A1H3ITI6_9RHOB|nr:phosphonate metabolism transcriptional regulator PhnF [Citreimonas salinaria]SDY30579.1 transcriptional regulator, GntR family [Citreimonas salinaria]
MTASTDASKTPLWQAIAATLRDEIAEGRYVPGDRLATEAQLAERFGVNRHTIRHALSALVADGLVRTRRGSGAFVAARPTDYPIGRRVRFRENLLRAGQRPEKRVLQIESRAATPGEASALRVEAGAAICAFHGLSLADGQPVAVSETVFPADRLPGIAEALAESEGVTDALACAGVADYNRASTRLTAVSASAVQALHLHLREGAPLLRSTGLDVDEAGVPVAYGRTWFAGDRVTLTLGDAPEGQGGR